MTKVLYRPSIENKVYGNLERRVRALEIRGGGGGSSNGNLEALWWGTVAPTNVGPAGGIWTVPFINGASVSWTIKRSYFRFESPSSSGSYQIIIQSSPAGGGFTSTNISTLTLGAGVNETSATPTGTLTSGQLLRIYWNILGVNGANFTIQLEAS